MIYLRQAGIMQAHQDERQTEAVGSFYRLAYDIVDEFRKADAIADAGDSLSVNFEAHPRQVLRGASHVFSPLGNHAVMALNQVGRGLDIYFEQVQRWNVLGVQNRILPRRQSINEARRRVGEQLDSAHLKIPERLRYSWVGADQDVFTELCSHPSIRRTTPVV